MKPPRDMHRSRRMWRDWDRKGGVFARRPGRGRRGARVKAMVLAVLIAILAWTQLPVQHDRVETGAQVQPTALAATRFTLCHEGGGRDCVIDGDTFRVGGVKIRIADIDAPETHPSRCAREAELGAAATGRLHTLLNGGTVRLHRVGRDHDRYGRKLRTVSVDGRAVGDMLVAEGLARRYTGGPRAGWCGDRAT